MPITTGSFAKLLWPGLNSIYGKSYSEYPDEWRALYDVQKSSKNYEEDLGVSSFGLVPEKSQGEGITYDTEMQGFISRYVHTTYGLGFVITREMFEDDQYDVVGNRRAKGLAFSVKTTLNTLGAAIYNNAVTSGWTGGDGVVLLSAAHPTVQSGTYSNLSSSTMSEAALESAFIAIKKMTNDRGLRINLQPSKLIIPPDLEFACERILGSSLRPATTDNDTNALKALGKFPGGAQINHYLTGTTSWYILTNCPDGMKAFERRKPEFDMDNDFDTENAKFKTSFRISFGWTDPRCIYGYDT